MRTLIKILFLLTPFFLLSCSKEIDDTSYVVDISEELAQIKKQASNKINTDNLIQLPSQQEITSDTVSYTHLTLPTKLSV